MHHPITSAPVTITSARFSPEADLANRPKVPGSAGKHDLNSRMSMRKKRAARRRPLRPFCAVAYQP